MAASGDEPRPKRRKRRPDAAREEALAAARRLLLDHGPGAVTLARVGGEIGMSHTNLIHHFGSAGALHGALMTAMVRDLTDTIDGLVAAVKSGEAAPLSIVDPVFEAFGRGGAGQLAAWLVLAGERAHLAPVRQAVIDLVDALAGRFARLTDADARVRSTVLLIAIVAFGDAVIGPDLRDMLDQEPGALRRALAGMLPALFLAAG